MLKQVFLLSVLFLINCPTPQEKVFNLKEELDKRILYNYDQTKNIKVIFSTVRKTKGEPSCLNNYFTTAYEPSEKYGICEVSVPVHHDVGAVEQNQTGDQEQYFKVLGYKPLNKDAFVQSINQNSHDEVLIFIHGFNVKFEEAIMRAAQIRYDLKFSGEVILFSWPAGADEGIFNQIFIKDTYVYNRDNAVASRNHFKDFINTIALTKKKIHIMVHSMGHQVVLPALNEIGKEKIISELVLNAPDFEAVEFKRIVPSLKKNVERITVYCSPGDNALVASSKVNLNKRIGSCEKIPDVDMINVNPIDTPFLGFAGLGHGYYSSRPIITDLFQLLLGIKVEKRLFIRKSTEGGGEDYVLRR